ncbi:unnamed protein product [Phyllotreta striolata]|uniref:Uncharacterized protein n=1 Tax=Phyllotreta striolata TaxID=444603 RepID=A0A9N9TY91_PHYSR|nr:unnamed protein product [Phyllotreta striolata]
MHTSGETECLLVDLTTKTEEIVDDRNRNNKQNSYEYLIMDPSSIFYTPPNSKLLLLKKNNKFYKIVLPHNVIPSSDFQQGSVIINIPEAGPLVIKLDPNAKKQTPVESDVMEPFSLDFDSINTTNKEERTAKECNKLVKQRMPLGKQSKDSTKVSRSANRDVSFHGFSERDCVNSIARFLELRVILKNQQLLIKSALAKKQQIVKRNEPILKEIINQNSSNNCKQIRQSISANNKNLIPTIPITKCDSRFNKHLIKHCKVTINRSKDLDDRLKKMSKLLKNGQNGKRKST